MTKRNYLEELDSLVRSDITTFLFEKKLIFDSLECVHCSIEMKLSRFNGSPLGFNWRCLNTECKHYQTTLSVLHGSFFENSALSPIKTLKIVFYLLKKTKQSNIISFLGVDQKTILRIKKKLIALIKDYFLENPIRLGGANKVVQIDEAKLNFNVKSHRGRSAIAPDWAITMVDVSTFPGRGYAEMVPDRSAATLVPIIESVVRSGSSIHTDEWSAYSTLNNRNSYNHLKLAHKYNFVDPISGVHTQNVESFNNKIKTDIKTQKGVRRSNRSDFLELFLFIDTFKDVSFDKVLELLKIY